ncbi:MAG TPA: enterotoxin [Candidatus Sulfotelmatobacter sp.]|nr:enterotoxin [Candidatus Sulfotelmatobacter sp.]
MTAYSLAFLGAIFFHLACGGSLSASGQTGYLYGIQPGKPEASVESGTITLQNGVLTAKWDTSEGRLHGVSFVGASLGAPIHLPENVFTLLLADGRIVTSATMRVGDGPRIEELAANPSAARLEEHFTGKRIVVRLEEAESNLAVTWSAILREGDNYVRQELTILAAKDMPIREVWLFDFNLPSAHVQGTVKGSPVTAGNLFLGFEHPLSRCGVDEEHVRCLISRELPIRAGQSVSYSSVIGISPTGQMRRGFLNYVERERAHPYRPFLHYNSWYDIGYGNRYGQAAALDVIHAFGEELSTKRAVKLDSFLFDDGWDDPRSMWSFGAGFPDGFTLLRIEAAKYGAAPGVWLSPWGGYDKAKEERMKYGKQQEFEMNEGGFALSGPKYFARFREVTLKFVRNYGINQFKIDGTGNVNNVFPGSEFDSDFLAAISLIQEWRALEPDIFVNLTTGTYPSPFWLQYADSIWRGGEDHSFAGVGPWREKWITYRDAETYAGIVKLGPLFPLNSLMLHGIIYARQAERLGDDPEHAFAHEVHDYFGSGTQLQEMYITHALLSDADWDTLAEAANWSRQNAATLVDAHWVGGDPGKLKVYGWAAWSADKGILTLRNPSDKSQSISLDLGEAFELPPGAPRKFIAHSPWPGDQNKTPIPLAAGESHTFRLQPFEVLTLEAAPIQ